MLLRSPISRSNGPMVLLFSVGVLRREQGHKEHLMETKKKEKKERNGNIKSQSYDFGNSIAK